MELFVLFSVFFSFCNPLLGVEAGFRVWDCSTALIVSLCLYAVIYVFKAIALSTMAKNAGKDKLVWCAFVPVASTYLMGKLAGDTRFFNHTFKKIGLIAMITEIVVILAFLCSYVPQYYIIDGGYYLEPVKGSGGLQIVDSVPLWLFNLYKVGDIVYSILSWIYLFVFVFLYIAIFRTYYARGHVLFTIISALFPVSAFFLFAIRNNPAVNYEKFMQEQMERMRRAQQGNPYNPYGNTPYGQDPYNGDAPAPPDDPFDEFSSQDKNEGRKKDDNDPDDFFN